MYYDGLVTASLSLQIVCRKCKPDDKHIVSKRKGNTKYIRIA